MQMNLTDYVSIYNINDVNICTNMVEKLAHVDWEKHAYNDPITSQNITYDDDLEITYHDDLLTSQLSKAVEKCVTDYLNTIPPIPFRLQEICDLRFNRYAEGTNMKIHHDHIHTLFDGERKGVPIITIVGLLNNDFEGGEFLLFGNKTVSLQAGDILVFPSNFLFPHAVSTVTKGTRYSFVAWGW